MDAGSMRRRRGGQLLNPARIRALAGAAPPQASAAAYTVKVCTPDSKAGDGITQADENAISIAYFPCGNSRFEQVSLIGVGLMKGAQSWTLRAPTGTKIGMFSAEISFAPEPAWASGVQWEFHSAADANNELLDSARMGAIPADGPVTFTPGSESLTARMFCPMVECNGGEPLVRVGNLIVEVIDQTAPTGSLTVAGGPVRGTVGLPFRADDLGAGVASVALVVDGQEQPLLVDGNGGNCQKPYKLMAPCKPTLSGTLALESRNFKDGPHQVQVAVEDGAGLTSLSAPKTVTIHNAPANTARPTLVGRGQVGANLTVLPGEWVGDPATFTFAYQWLHCPAGGQLEGAVGCAAIPGASQASYAPASNDVGSRVIARVTATNAVGSESALSSPSDPVLGLGGKAGPVLSGVSLSHPRFRVAGARHTRPGAKGAIGTVVRFSSSEAARLSIAISRGNAKPLATLTRTIAAGPGHLAFSGRIGKKPLRPGRYRMSVTATDAAGTASGPTSLAFTILRG